MTLKLPETLKKQKRKIIDRLIKPNTYLIDT